MSAVHEIPAEVEQERTRQAAELAADHGPDWAQDYAPGSFGCHELLDRAAMFAAIVERDVQSHPACVAHPELYLLAEQAAAALHELYQRIGAEHLTAEEPSAREIAS